MVCSLCLAPGIAVAETRPAEQIFHRWIKRQSIRTDVPFAELKKNLRPAILPVLRERMPEAIYPQLQFAKYLLPPPAGLSPKAVTERDQEALRALGALYGWLDGNVGELLRWLQSQPFASAEIDAQERKEALEGKKGPRDKYRSFLLALLTQPDWIRWRLALFALGNHLFEYCFQPETYPELRRLLSAPATLPIVRMIYEGIWYSLGRNSWIHWHRDALAGLRRESEAGKQVVYVAGGSDIYRLLQWGIYNLRVIDPMFPTQNRYYSEGWEYLVKGGAPNGGVGDEIVFSEKDPHARMVRTAYAESGKLTDVELPNGARTTLPRSTTVWAVRDQAGKDLGQFVLERRFVQQEDFRPHPKRAFVISFNELFFVVTPGRQSWGLDLQQFAPDFQIFVKQLRSPVSRAVLLNLRAVGESSLPFTFGSDVN
jgi:hypothetical protein